MSRVCLEPSSTFRSHVIHRSILQVHNESSIIGALGELSTARRCHALRRDAPSHESSQVVTLGAIGQGVLHYELHRYTIKRPLSAAQYNETHSLNCRFVYKRL